MKIKIDLESGAIEYLDKKPFIQGRSDIQNKVEIYCPVGAVNNIKVAYTMDNGRSTIAIANSGSILESYDGVEYQKIWFNVPYQMTSLAGQLMMSFIVTTALGISKYNALNTIVKSSDFEGLLEAAEDADQTGLIESVQALSDSVGMLENQEVDHEQRINYLESIAVDSNNYVSTRLSMLPNVENTTENNRLYVITNTDNVATKLTVRQLQDRIIRTAESVPDDLQVGQYVFLKV